jgi:VWFA-related protein
MKEKVCLWVSRRNLLRMAAIAPFTRGLLAETDTADTPFTITSTVERVILDVSVKDRRNHYVTDLQEKSFRVLENGRPQPIIHFSSADTPVTVGLVLDDSGSMRPKRPEVVMAGLAFAKESNPDDQFFVVNFNNYIAPGLPDGMAFTDDLQTLRAALYMGNPEGQTALYDAIVFSLKHLEKGRQPKKTLIVVSDGGDNVSRASFQEVVGLVQASEATIYTVGLFAEDDSDRNPRALRKLARLSGGDYFNPSELDDVIPIFHQIAKDIRHRYTITYAPDPHLDATAHPVRSIQVEARNAQNEKLKVRTRTQYSFEPFSKLLAQGKPR